MFSIYILDGERKAPYNTVSNSPFFQELEFIQFSFSAKKKNEEATELVFLFQSIIEEKAEFLSVFGNLTWHQA